MYIDRLLVVVSFDLSGLMSAEFAGKLQESGPVI